MSTALLSVLCGIGGMFGWGIYDFLGGVYSKQIGHIRSIFWSQLAGLIAILLLLIAFSINLSIPVWIMLGFNLMAFSTLVGGMIAILGSLSSVLMIFAKMR